MINSMAAALNGEKDTWVAGPNIFFEGKSDRDAKALLGKRAAGAEAVARRRRHELKVQSGRGVTTATATEAAGRRRDGQSQTRRRRFWRMALDAVAEAVAWRLVARWCGHRLKGRSGEGGDDGDGDGGGEAATGRMITDESASGLEVACAAACGTCSWRGELS